MVIVKIMEEETIEKNIPRVYGMNYAHEECIIRAMHCVLEGCTSFAPMGSC